jgi:ABC-type multidrug transport system fused ATPase/permease subunit
MVSSRQLILVIKKRSSMQLNHIRQLAKQDQQKSQVSATDLQLYGRLSLTVWQYKLALFGTGLAILGLSFTQLAIPQITKYTIDVIFPEKRWDLLVWVGVGILGMAVITGCLNFIRSYATAAISQNLVRDLRQDLYNKVINLSIDFFEAKGTGALVNRLTKDVDSIDKLVTTELPEIVVEVIVFITIAGYLLATDWQLTVVLLATLPLSILSTYYFGKKFRDSYSQMYEKQSLISHRLQETFTNVKLIKTCGNEAYEIDRFTEANNDYHKLNLRITQLTSALSPLVDGINYLGLTIILVYGAYELIDGAITIGDLAAFLAYAPRLNQPAKRFSKILNTIQKGSVALERIYEILDSKPKVADKPEAITLPTITGKIVIQDVSFAYQPAVPVFSHLNLEIDAGEQVALVGASGAGKTTLTNLLLRFYDPNSGNIYVDGHNLRNVQIASFRKQIGIVSQDILLLNDTIEANIAYGKLDASSAEIAQAAELAYAHDFVTELPQKYQTIVGERGLKLSGGQRQRLAIARALVVNPCILILDEATSSLDTEAEISIQNAIAKICKNRTTIAIAHRLSTIRQADRIVFIDRGKILEIGSHEQLMTKNANYARVVGLQYRI